MIKNLPLDLEKQIDDLIEKLSKPIDVNADLRNFNRMVQRQNNECRTLESKIEATRKAINIWPF